MITVKFVGDPMPVAFAAQTGTGPFFPLTPQSGTAAFTVPAGTNRYSIAYVCLSGETPGLLTGVVVLQATIQDGTTFNQFCSAPLPKTGQATGTADASSVSSAIDINIVGGQGFNGFVGSSNGPFTIDFPAGTNDIAAIALAQVTFPQQLLAVKIIRNQTVPGVINGGATITLGQGDLLTSQSLIVNNIPAGFADPSIDVEFRTANGTSFSGLGVSHSQYQALPAAAVASGDFYFFQATSSDIATQSSTVGVIQTNTGGPTILNLPNPFSGPVISLPTFTFNYSGFSGLPNLLYGASIRWPVRGPVGGTDFHAIALTTTGNFLNGSNAVTIPDASAVQGFFPPPGSGVNIVWSSSLFGGTTTIPLFLNPLQPNSTFPFVENSGNLTVP